MEYYKHRKLEFLVGYRGILAIIVVISHSRMHDRCEIVNYLVDIVQTVGVCGFFVLSSFLLTCHLLTELKNVNSNSVCCKAVIILFYSTTFSYLSCFCNLCYSIKIRSTTIGGLFNNIQSYYYNSWLDLITFNKKCRQKSLMENPA